MTEFFAGMSVMAVELGASRLLAPYFSSSQIVWTIIIGTIMIAMAAGNLYGGKAADKNPDPSKLYRRILIAALWIAAIPVLGKYVILGISALLIFTVSTNYLIVAAFASCLVLFIYPLFLLGTVTPSLVRATVDSLDASGTTVGRMNACNTIGSILGTFLPTFVTIPAVGTAVTFLLFSAVLLIIALIYIISEKGFGRQTVISILIFILCIVFGHSSSFAFWEDDLTYEGESVYNYLQVKEDEQQIVFSTNVLFGVQSVLIKDGGLTGMYYDFALAAPAMSSAKENLQILILGNGTGTFAKQCLRYFPNCSIEAVEIDAAITELAYEYFEFPESVAVTEYDGRAFLEVIDRHYDVILVDAYQDITIPFQMSTLEFFSLVKEHLYDTGVLAVNLNMHGDSGNSINSYLCDTISAVFPFVSTVEVPYSTNLMLFAAAGEASESLLRSAVKNIPDRELNSLLQDIMDTLQPYHSRGLLLTDDKAPVELLGMQMIDHIIDEELRYFKGVYQRYGIRGLLDSILT